MHTSSIPAAGGQQHADGTSCLAGTRQTPKNFAPCCESFAARVDLCVNDVRYEWYAKQKSWVIAIAPEAGGGGIEFAFCPHCGSKL